MGISTERRRNAALPSRAINVIIQKYFFLSLIPFEIFFFFNIIQYEYFFYVYLSKEMFLKKDNRLNNDRLIVLIRTQKNYLDEEE